MQEQVRALMSQFYKVERAQARAAIDQLQALPRAEAWRSLQQMLLSDDGDTRCTGALAMMLIDADKASSSTESLLFDNNETVRLYICNLLNDFGDSRLTPAMAKLAENDASADVRFSACFFLADHGDERALPALRVVAQSDMGADYEGRPIIEIAQRAIVAILNRASAN